MPAETKTTTDATSGPAGAAQTLGSVAQQARTPLLAALGAGDLAAQALLERLEKVRAQLSERAESARQDLPNDLDELRGKLEPAELRKLADQYAQSARQLYGYLADRGEEALDRLQTEPRVQQVRERVETAQGKIDDAVGEVRELADDVLGTVTPSRADSGEQADQAAEEDSSATGAAGSSGGTSSGGSSSGGSSSKNASAAQGGQKGASRGGSDS
ncbi:hypothetical protein GCM10027174_37390 [Salinifilum aidingensis]